MTKGAALLGNSAAFLPDGVPNRRPRFAFRRRPQGFRDAFESQALFYDCFWHHDGKRVLLVGPPPVNLDYDRMVFAVGGTLLHARFHTSLSVTITEVLDVPAGATELRVSFARTEFVLAIQSNECAAFAGSRMIFTVNKDNELGWIREWAVWHARHHGADAAIIVDNGSTKYGVDEIAATLTSVPGIGQAQVAAWPYKFGPIDFSVFSNPFWSRFFQIASMSMVLRRCGMLAYGLLDCDIDELAVTQSGRSMFELAKESEGGLVVFRGTWVEALPEPGSPANPPHRAYRHLLADPKAAASRQRKWALDPSRDWVRRLNVHPYWHWIENRARNAKSMPDDASYRHFRGINTNWKVARTTPPAEATVRDPMLDAGFAELDA